jgi:hypothetical protein
MPEGGRDFPRAQVRPHRLQFRLGIQEYGSIPLFAILQVRGNPNNAPQFGQQHPAAQTPSVLRQPEVVCHCLDWTCNVSGSGRNYGNSLAQPIRLRSGEGEDKGVAATDLNPSLRYETIGKVCKLRVQRVLEKIGNFPNPKKTGEGEG